MEYPELGRTGLDVSEVGFDARGIGGSQWGGADAAESLRALGRAIDPGVSLGDTALAYGDGRSEGLVGEVVSGRLETIYVATKVPPKNLLWPAASGVPLEDVFPVSHVRACAERSLSNLAVDTV